jgi:PKD repeat protein
VSGGLATTAHATTIVMPTDAQLVAKAPLIVEGTVVRSQAVERNGGIWTESVVAVARVLKGDALADITAELTVREIGGQLGNRFTKVFGAPEYIAGERVLAFLIPTPRGDYQTVDLFVGKFTEERTAAGQRLWTRHDESAGAALLDRDFHPIEAKNVQRQADGFESFIHDRVAGRNVLGNYGVENPVLERDLPAASPGGTHPITGNFTLIDEPTIYRWSRFDNGGSAQWFSNGSQTGYSGGGTSEIQAAMNAWDSYTSAKINYVYAGTTTNISGLNQPNGVNEILFNDPLNEIAGSFNAATGGVVGEGGFNGVTDGGFWQSTFAADPSHPQASFHVFAITEGNLTIQNNVSPSSGVSGAVLAEIVAHELGHTLGFGHSSDNTALMYANVTGRGASLRADDQTAARWLYPNGSAPSQPPATSAPNAPTALTSNGSGTSVTLRWTDNATNESGVNVYLSAGSGAYARVATTSANATSIIITGLSAGSYRSYVAATNAVGESAASNVVTFTLSGVPASPGLSAEFDVTPSAPRAGLLLQFSDRSTGGPTSWSWSFGDGGSSSAQSPTHVFATAGTYNVTLSVSNGGSNSQLTRTLTIANATGVWRSLISAAAQTNGVGGSVWRTELTLFNAGSEGANVQFIFIPSGGGSLQTRSIFLTPLQTLTYDSALPDLFGIGSGAGAIAIEATSAGSMPNLKVFSRTFMSGTAGTYGQAVPGIAGDVLPQTQYLTGLESDADYRTNLGLVNRGGVPLTATLTLLAENRVLGTAPVALPENSFQQASLATYFPAIAGASFARLSMQVTTPSPSPLSIYASVIDNRTQDPVYIQGTPVAAGNELFIPVVGRAPGANGTFWRSDVTIFNYRGVAIGINVRYLAGGADNRNAPSHVLTIPAGNTVTVSDVLSTFGLTSGTGALQLFWLFSGGAPAVTSRTYTTVTGGGTYGQSIDPLSAQGFDSVVPGLRSDGGYRSNLGFVNSGDSQIRASVTLLSSSGQTLGSAAVTLPPKSQMQTSVAALFPSVSTGSLGSFTLRAHTNDAPTLSAYGSIVDNGSGDPVFFAGQ